MGWSLQNETTVEDESPFGHEHYMSRLDIFAGTLRYYRPGFWAFNFKAGLRELLILVPIVWMVYRMRVKGRPD